MRRYTIVLVPEPDGSAWNVTVPALPGCVTFGTTISEAVEMAKDAIRLWVDDMEARGEPVPADATPRVEAVEV